jgi:hypothetical protein
VDKTSHLKGNMAAGANQVFTDGRVEWFSWKKLEDAITGAPERHTLHF